MTKFGCIYVMDLMGPTRGVKSRGIQCSYQVITHWKGKSFANIMINSSDIWRVAANTSNIPNRDIPEENKLHSDLKNDNILAISDDIEAFFLKSNY